MAAQKPEIMQRKVGLLETVAMITGLVIGAGIFVLVPTLTGMTGPSVYLAFLIACLPSIFVVLYEIQLTGTLPVTGANYVTVTRVLSPFWGGVISFSAVLAIVAANILVSVGFSQYVIAFIQSFNPGFAMDGRILAITIMIFFSLINYFGVTIASWMQLVMFLAFVIGMLIFGITGIVNVNPANLTPLLPNGALMFVVVVVLASYVWSGLVALADIGGEVKNPRRNLPLALIISFIIILVLYVSQPFALVATMNWQEAAKIGSAAIMVDAGKLLPGWGIYVIFIAAMGAILTTVNALTWSASRDLLAWARDGMFPKAVAHLSKFKTPDLAILFITILEVLGVLIAATLDKYALASVLATCLIQIILAWCVLRIPRKLPELYKKSIFKFNAFWRWFAYIGTLVTSGLILLAGIFLDTLDAKGNPTKIPWVVLIFVGTLLLGIIWYTSRRAYLKRRGVDLDGNLQKVADATLAEAEERLSL
jgi:APA family basic amino acid/polyamine antiporter